MTHRRSHALDTQAVGLTRAAGSKRMSTATDPVTTPEVVGEDLQTAVARAFATDGPLAAADPGFRPRAAQDLLASRVAQAIDARETLVAEAGTGIGKTFAYLVPLLLSGCRAVVSTATKNLQDQLYLRDLPRLRAALGVPLRTALLKGRASYLCRWRLQQAQAEDRLPDRFAMRALQRVAQWSQATRSGDLAELDGLDERSPILPLVTSTRDNCLGTECPEFQRCHVVAARRRALDADLVVVNHHLFFADLALRDSGVAELLPTVDAAVFDEAHQIIDTGLQFLGTVLATAQIVELGRDLLAAGQRHARGLQPWIELQADLEQAARHIRLVCGDREGAGRGATKRPWAACEASLGPALNDLSAAAAAAAAGAQSVVAAAPDFARLVERAQTLVEVAAGLLAPVAADRVRWVESSSQQVRLVESPLDIRELLTEQREAAPKAWIFTSATLGEDEGLTWFTASTGLQGAHTLRVGSPFDYARQARLWVPTRFPLPQAADHPAAVGALAARCAAALGGRCFVLTTTLRVLPAIAQALREAAADLGLTVLVQGTEPRRALLQRFGDGAGRVLVGSHSFWEGIDLPGEALQCVLIDKLPFPPPSDPLIEARARQLRAEGREPFTECFVAETAIALKQGAGRLIRTETDRGLLVVCDPRLVRMGYGRRLLAALPPMPRVEDEAAALGWLSGGADPLSEG